MTDRPQSLNDIPNPVIPATEDQEPLADAYTLLKREVENGSITHKQGQAILDHSNAEQWDGNQILAALSHQQDVDDDAGYMLEANEGL